MHDFIPCVLVVEHVHVHWGAPHAAQCKGTTIATIPCFLQVDFLSLTPLENWGDDGTFFPFSRPLLQVRKERFGRMSTPAPGASALGACRPGEGCTCLERVAPYRGFW